MYSINIVQSHTKIPNYLYLIVFLLIALTSYGCTHKNNVVHVVGNQSNDFYKILSQNNQIETELHDSPMKAAIKAKNGEALMLFADKYPAERLVVSSDFFEIVKEKGLKVYLEFPSFLPGINLQETVVADLERAVVNSSFFKGMPDSLDVLSINGFNYISTNVVKSYIVAAKVAGFDRAVYGLPEKTVPILFELSDYPVLVSTTNLSNVVQGRYTPQKAWAGVWKFILDYVYPGNSVFELEWEPEIQASFEKTEALPAHYQKKSIEKGAAWFFNSKMLVHESLEDTLEIMKASGNWMLDWNASIPEGDGKNGVFECVFSRINEKGSQPIGIVRRGDCNAETAMALACAGKVLKKPEYSKIAENILDFYLIESDAMKGEYGNPNHGAYGLIPWGISNYSWYRASYGDDNARFLLGALTTSALSGSERWDSLLMKSMIALLRTTGKSGFRGSRIDIPDFEENGWRHYYERDIKHYSPHFEAYVWACMLWAYHKTGDQIFLERTEKAIKENMQKYPEGWQWTNGIAQEKARMLLPIAWLVRVKDTPESRDMLYRIVDDLLKLQDTCGAIREELGNLEMGKYPPPQNNEAYGTTEAPLIAQNGDKVSDLLYTTNFAFLGLHEAYYATNDPKIKKAVDKLTEFLCRIQVVSEKHPEIDGGWMRAFDYGRYEHWGSNADHGWGAWAIESGWTQGWIVSILALREQNTSIWDLTLDSKVKQHYAGLKKQMLAGIE
ncbi:hypothetical protein D1164_22365 [Mariniphaga sediminis]|uniref:Uncharacterized protein n=1 Tax=Mariniphaga sediminis TaxID=1628158 RepID=A0A399CX36_9BACT|nr:hypothetical protein [Mariniphaga sediminis]RIH62961.1 hypothetical protein D1164_22365 [Mariniphaga sediminis]